MKLRTGLKQGLLAAAALVFAAAGAAHADSLLEAAKRDDGEAALALLARSADKAADVGAAEVDGSRPLLWAAHHGDVELAKALLAAGADPNAANDYGALPMQEAAADGNAELLKVLLDAGADVESPNPEGQTALMAAARTGKTDAVKLLLERGANPNAAEGWGGQTALMWAVAQRQADIVDLLLAAGADPNARAVVRNWERHNTAEPRIKEMPSAGLTPLLYAAREGCVACAEKLVAAGADVNLPDPDNITPLILALLNRRFDTAAALIEAGADVNRWDWYGRTALFAAADTNIAPVSAHRDPFTDDAKTGVDVAAMLLERGADPNLRLKLIPAERAMGDRVADDHVMNVGATPLIRAAYSGDAAMVKLLLEHGADARIRSSKKVSAVFAAAATGGTRGKNKTEADIIACLEMLVPAGADPTWADDQGRTPLHMASRTNRGEVVRWLAAHGGDLNALDKEGRSVMGYATGAADWVAFGTSDVVGVLPEMVAVLEDLGLEAPPAAKGGSGAGE